MIVTEEDLKLIPEVLDAIQVFQDSQIRCKGMVADVTQMRESANNQAIAFLEKLVGRDKVDNKTLRKVLASMHNHVLCATKSGLGVYE